MTAQGSAECITSRGAKRDGAHERGSLTAHGSVFSVKHQESWNMQETQIQVLSPEEIEEVNGAGISTSADQTDFKLMAGSSSID
jgi:hypothetical protein